LFDGQGDCTDFSDECPTSEEFRQENIFSSRYQLIANPILRALVWIMGFLAIFGNIVCASILYKFVLFIYIFLLIFFLMFYLFIYILLA